MKRELICIGCPMGCRLSLESDPLAPKGYRVAGCGCPRGEDYAIKEVTAPTRMLTSTVRIEGGSVALRPQDARAPEEPGSPPVVAQDLAGGRIDFRRGAQKRRDRKAQTRQGDDHRNDHEQLDQRKGAGSAESVPARAKVGVSMVLDNHG